MDSNDWAALLPEILQNFSDALQQCKDGAFGDPRYTALAVSKIEAIFAEMLEIQEQMALDQQGTDREPDTLP